MTVLKGRVVTGVGNFSFWIEKLKDHYRDKTGLQLFPGTLNIQLDEPFDLPPERERLEAAEYGGDCVDQHRSLHNIRSACCHSADGQADNEPQSKMIIEVACEVKLRDQHHLSDGDVVEVGIMD